MLSIANDQSLNKFNKEIDFKPTFNNNDWNQETRLKYRFLFDRKIGKLI